MISNHLDKNNLHHAYLIEGDKEEIIPEVFSFCEDLNIKTYGNPDFYHITFDNFKIDEAIELRSMSTDKSFTFKKIFVICVNSFSVDAQNVLLKMFEEPTRNTHFFLIMPDINPLLKTFISRFYLIKNKKNNLRDKDAEKFISMPLQKRIDFIKELLTETEDKELSENTVSNMDSVHTKAISFLNTLEVVLHEKFIKNFYNQNSLRDCLEHFLKVREFLRMPGSSVKVLMESVAIVVPNL